MCIKTGALAESPSQYNRAYYPTKTDINKGMVTKVITKQRSGLPDQGAVLQLLQEYH